MLCACVYFVLVGLFVCSICGLLCGCFRPMVLGWRLSGDCWWLLGGAVRLVSGV